MTIKRAISNLALVNSVGAVSSVGAFLAWVAQLRRFMDGVDQILAWVTRLAWVHKILAWAK